MEAGVEIEASELREKPQGAFPTKFKARQRAAGATSSVDAQTLQRLLEQQNSLAKFVREQFEWQKKVNAYITKGKMTIEEPVLPEWMQEENEDNVPLSVNLEALKKERVKRPRSSVTKGKSPAKKKQKKVSSEEEADELEKASVEVLSDEEEEEQVEEEGSSSDKTDIQADSPPTPKQTLPQHSEPTTHTQNISSTPQSKQQNQPSPQKSPIQPQPEKQPSQQLPSQEKPSEDVATSEAAASNPETQPMSPPKTRLRVKSVAKKRPFGRKTRQELAAVSEETSAPDADVAQGAREKLPIKKKTVAPKGKPATATSAAFVAASESESAPAAEREGAEVPTSAEKEAAARLVELQAGKEQEKAEEQAQDKVIAAGDVSTDVITSQEPEVEKAQVDPKEPAPAMKAWEDEKKRVAEVSIQKAQETETSAATSTMAGSEETITAAEAGGEKKKKEKKKKADQPGIPPRQSTRLRSGALNK